jgi:hypothetical protein
VVRHDRHLLGRGTRDGVGDEVREGDLVAGALELLAARVHHGDGHRAEGRRGRDLQRLVHVPREHRRAALEHGGTGGRRRGGGAGGLRPRGRGGGGSDGLRGEHIGLRDPAGRAAAGDGGEVDALDRGNAAGDR